MERNNNDENRRWEIYQKLELQNLQTEMFKNKVLAHSSASKDGEASAIIRHPLPKTITHQLKSEAAVCLPATPQQQATAEIVHQSAPKTVAPQSKPVTGVHPSFNREVVPRQAADEAFQSSRGRFHSYRPYRRWNRNVRWRNKFVVQIGGRPDWGRDRGHSQSGKNIYFYIS